MKKILALSLSSVLFIFPAYAADNAVTLTAGSGVTMRTKDIGAGVQSPFNILGDATGTAIYGTAGSANSNVLSVQGIASGTAMPISGTLTAVTSITNAVTVAQPTAANLNATIVGTGTLAVQAAQSGTWNITNISGTVSLPTGAATSALQTTINTTLGTPFQAGGSIGNTTFAATQATSSNLKAQVDPLTAASWGIGTSTQNSASATNGQLALGQFNTTPSTITTGNMSPLQLDNAGNLLVNIKTGASSGAVAQGSTTSGQTGLLIQGAVTTASPSYTTAQTSPLSLDTTGALRVNVTAGGAGGGIVTQATAANLNAAVQSPTLPVSTMNSANANAGINAATAAVFDDVAPTSITENSFGFLRMSANRNAYNTIRDAAGNERGVNVDASNRLTSAPTLVSGSVNSGAYASGAFASGSIASGALASGSIASGAMVDLLTFQGTKAAGTAAANSLLTGAVFNTSAPTLTNGQQAALQVTAAGSLHTTVDNTNANGQATAANSSPVVLASDKNVSIGPYPIGAVPITATITGSTLTATATLAGASSVSTYICGFSIRANATAATTGNATVSGISPATMNFTQWVAPAASGIGVTEEVFSPCLQSSSTNTSITASSFAAGSGGIVSVTAWGYRL